MEQSAEIAPLFFLIKDSKGKLFLLLSDIAYLQADRNYTIIFLTDGKTQFIVCGCLKTHLERLERTKNFCRIHHSYAVRINYVLRIDDNGTITMRNGIQLDSTTEHRHDLERRMPFC